MRLRALYLHEPFVIDGYTVVAGGPPSAREQSFHADDGWELYRVERGVFTVKHSTMAEPMWLEPSDASYVEAEPMRAVASEVVTELAPSAPKKGKRH